MSERINGDLIRGSVNTIVLRSLFESDRYGYEIIKYVEEQTNGQYVLKQPTLYSSLRRLENMGFVSFYWGEESNGGRRKYYTLTALGRSVFEKNQHEYRFSRDMIDKLISEGKAKVDEDKKQNKEVAENSLNDENVAVVGVEPEIQTVDAVPDVEIETSSPIIEADEVKEVAEVEKTETDEVVVEELSEPELEREEVVYHSSIKPDDTDGKAEFDKLFAEFDRRAYSQKVTESEAKSTTVVTDYTADYYSTVTSDEAAVRDESDDDYAFDSTDYASYDAYDSPVERDPAATETAATAESVFYSYDTAVSEVMGEQADYTDYKKKLSSIFDTEYDTKTVADRDEPPFEAKKEAMETTEAGAPFTVTEKIMIRSFGKITEDMQRSLGERVKIRTPNGAAAKEYNEKFYYYDNKLLLYKYGILFLIMAIEAMLTFVIVRGVCGIRTDYDVPLYVASVLFSLAFPVFAAASFYANPTKRKRVDFNLKTSLIFRIIITLQLSLIVYALNVFFGMPIAGSAQYSLSIALPIVLATNVPISAVVFNGLYKSKKFAVK